MIAADGDSCEVGLWSSFTLELLARATLSKVSPALLADAQNWHNIYYSLGHEPLTKKFIPRSITTAEVFKRLNGIFPKEFTEQLKNNCISHIERRNKELHTSEMVFDSAKESDWLPPFYEACAVLLDSLGSDLDSFFGKDGAKVARTRIGAAKEAKTKEIRSTIESHKTVWEGKEPSERTKLTKQAEAWATKDTGHRVKCPACGAPAIVTGDPVTAPKKTIEGDIIHVRQSNLPGRFECQACGLKIVGLPNLIVADLGDAYVSTSSFDASAYYGEVEGDYWDDDNNEPMDEDFF